jgi:hypothetical protein
VSLPPHPGDDDDQEALAGSPRSKLLIVLGIAGVAVLAGVVVALHLTGVMGPGELH